jgi:hypothetical protein
MWVGDETTWSTVAPEILEQEHRIAVQRQLIDRLSMSGHRDLALEGRQLLEEMCDTLARMRRDERVAKIARRERSFAPVSEEEAMEQVMRTCPL